MVREEREGLHRGGN